MTGVMNDNLLLNFCMGGYLEYMWPIYVCEIIYFMIISCKYSVANILIMLTIACELTFFCEVALFNIICKLVNITLNC